MKLLPALVQELGRGQLHNGQWQFVCQVKQLATRICMTAALSILRSHRASNIDELSLPCGTAAYGF